MATPLNVQMYFVKSSLWQWKAGCEYLRRTPHGYDIEWMYVFSRVNFLSQLKVGYEHFALQLWLFSYINTSFRPIIALIPLNKFCKTVDSLEMSVRVYGVKSVVFSAFPGEWQLITLLAHWGYATIFHTTFSNAFSWMKIFAFRWKFQWSLFPRVQLTIFHHWFR